MRHIDTTKTQHTGTATHRGVDELMDETLTKGSSADGDVQNVYEEGFGASSGVRNETAETGGRIKAPEQGDDAIPDRTTTTIEEENAGLADS